MSDADPFATHRSYLLGLAYRMLGSASDAEDVLQDAYLRYTAAPRGDVRAPRAYFTTMVTRLCLDRLKAARTTREQYVGPWLPEPILTADEEIDPQHTAERHESITLAFLVILETLTPHERAVFLLREVFEYPYEEIAPIVGTSTANCRQLFHRAKEQLAVHRPRFPASPDHQQRLVTRFLAAIEGGNIGALQEILAADVHLWADSGGKARAPQRLVVGRKAVAKLMPVFLANVLRLLGGDATALRTLVTTVNGEPAVLALVRDQLDAALICSVAGEQITALRIVRNPDKLAYLRRQLDARAEQQ